MTRARRRLLRSLAGLAAALVSARALPVAAQGPASLSAEAFSRLSSALTGYPPAGATANAKMLKAFATPARRRQLAVLARLVTTTPVAEHEAALRTAGLDKLADALVGAWYSGLVPGPAGESLVLYTDALMWTAMTFSKPMGVCGGPMGYWAQPPQ